MGSIERRPLKLFIRYDGRGKAISGSSVWRKKMPRVGTWIDITNTVGYRCCTPTTTTTTTTEAQ